MECQFWWTLIRHRAFCLTTCIIVGYQYKQICIVKVSWYIKITPVDEIYNILIIKITKLKYKNTGTIMSEKFV